MKNLESCAQEAILGSSSRLSNIITVRGLLVPASIVMARSMKK